MGDSYGTGERRTLATSSSENGHSVIIGALFVVRGGAGRTSEACTETRCLARSAAFSEAKSTGDPFSASLGAAVRDLVLFLKYAQRLLGAVSDSMAKRSSCFSFHKFERGTQVPDFLILVVYLPHHVVISPCTNSAMQLLP